MSDVAIKVEGLGKRYRLGAQRQSYGSLRDSLTGLGKRFLPSGKDARAARKPEFWALKDVNFEVKRGEVLGIIGRNGAGKSTLLKLLSEITEPTEGRITMNGRVASLLEVGTGFHPELSGRENIYLNGAILGMTKKEIAGKFDEIVAFAEVEQFIDTQVKHYSSGMYLRLAFAVAAHLEPEILLVDEVLAVGDVHFQRKCIGKMSQVAKAGRTVLFVSHDLNAIKSLCPTSILLRHGNVELADDTQAVLSLYLSSSSLPPSIVALHNSAGDGSGSTLRVLSVELLNSINSSFTAPWDEPLRLAFSIRPCTRIQYLSFGVACQTEEGLDVFTVRSGEQLAGPFLESVEYRVSLVIQHNLRAGRFILLLGITSGPYSHYYNPCVTHFEILNVSIGSSTYSERDYGVIRCDSSWSYSEHQAEAI